MNQSSSFKWHRFFTYFLLGAILGCVLGLSFKYKPSFLPIIFELPELPKFELPKFEPPRPTPLFWLTVAGAFGGLAYAMRNDELRLPKKTENMWNPGVIADCLTGIAGAYVVILIMPGDFPNTKDPNTDLTIQILATGIIGGYGGRGILDRALDDILRRTETLENKQGTLENKQGTLENKQGTLESKDLSGAEAMDLLERYLDEDLGLPPEQLEKLKQDIKDASSSLQARIFLEGKRVLAHNLRDNNLQMIGRTIPVFEALVENDTKNKAHRNHAQLGYAFKGKNEWKRAEEELSKAISIRDKENDQNQSFRIYEFHRAICKINLDEDFNKEQQSLPSVRDVILQDLRSASRLKNVATKINSNKEIGLWLTRNKISLEEVGLPKGLDEMSAFIGSNKFHADGAAAQKTPLETGESGSS